MQITWRLIPRWCNPTSTGQSIRLIDISNTSSAIVANNQVPLGFTPAAVVGSVVYGVEQSTGQVLGVDPTTGAVVVRDLLTYAGSFTPAYALCSDGVNIWALASTTGSPSTQQVILDKISPTNGAVVQQQHLAGIQPNEGAGTLVVTDGVATINEPNALVTVCGEL